MKFLSTLSRATVGTGPLAFGASDMFHEAVPTAATAGMEATFS
jgi:hypothetical protein